RLSLLSSTLLRFLLICPLSFRRPLILILILILTPFHPFPCSAFLSASLLHGLQVLMGFRTTTPPSSTTLKPDQGPISSYACKD
ncbi:hypothetical protein BC939DRAFT_446178, partial [Gamsiella multidivaricata]|uniref:uncharacterized protein n=1 Tax=Gamsiella multidivaricata TaxID=101098 RepID=UPI00221F9CF4